MVIRIFLVAAIVLIAFAVVASAADNLMCLGVLWTTWLCASLLSIFTDWIFGGPAFGSGGYVAVNRRQAPPQ